MALQSADGQKLLALWFDIAYTGWTKTLAWWLLLLFI